MEFKLEPTAGDAGYLPEAADLRAIFYLRRLSRLVTLREMAGDDSGAELLGLVNHSIYSTYLDLRDLGWKDEARLLLRARCPSTVTPKKAASRETG